MPNNNFTIDEVRDFWNSTAEIYDRINRKIGPAHYQRFTESLNHLDLNENDKVLNIWSRTGNAVKYILDCHKIDLYNLEVSPVMIEIARKKHPGVKFSITDLNKLPFEKDYFDAILSLETLEHAPDPQALIYEFHRVLKPGKKLVMSLPPKTAELPLRIYEKFFENHGEGPHRFIASKEVKQMLKQAGFELSTHKGTLLLPAGPKFLQDFGEFIINRFQSTPIKELGIRQFYVSKKNENFLPLQKA